MSRRSIGMKADADNFLACEKHLARALQHDCMLLGLVDLIQQATYILINLSDDLTFKNQSTGARIQSRY